MRRLTLPLVIAWVSLSLGWAADGGDAPAAQAPPPAASGQATYDRLCTSCHGADGRGNAVKAKALKLDPQLLDLARPEAAKLTRDETRKILVEGKGKMPAYGAKLGAAEIDAALEHAEGLVAPAK
jgi:mono/diheme cytochrome c family protein